MGDSHCSEKLVQGPGGARVPESLSHDCRFYGCVVTFGGNGVEKGMATRQRREEWAGRRRSRHLAWGQSSVSGVWQDLGHRQETAEVP